MAAEKRTFHIYKLENGKWRFWFNGLGKSAKDMHRRIAWVKRAEIPRHHIKVVEPHEKP